jgi:hypothetical protein
VELPYRTFWLKSGALSPLKRFAFEIRDIDKGQSLPGHTTTLKCPFGRERLDFVAAPVDPFTVAMRRGGMRLVDKSV